ncbi:uncharacterized protein B0H18DRAFT_1048391 [Fomitopsis serialis]|uniref:uncharacterized protein n=1 Tax=Fomitopsis serialis TaxID=139415 RepID=UPI0020078448|nr:uncharacterized protein B0H18DRAFT_1048391 [Neoantrodia serialis]KAH9913496.1 hypothetical protein B0H18DRAFT_1048391 [Neoantrodia serialis]
MSVVPHHYTTDCQVMSTACILPDAHATNQHDGSTSEGTSMRDVPTSTHAMSVPASTPVSVMTNREPVESNACDSSGYRLFISASMIASDHEDGTSAPRYDCEVVPDVPRDSTSVLQDDLAVVLYNSQGCTMDLQRCMTIVPQPTSTATSAAGTSSSLLDVQGDNNHHSPSITDRLSDRSITLASASQDGLHFREEVQVSGGFDTAETPVAQLASLNRHLDSSSHHSLRDPGAPTSAQPDDHVSPSDARARDRGPTAALRTVQRPALTDPNRLEWPPDRQPGENFTVLADGSFLGTSTQFHTDLSAAPDIAGDYDRHHGSQIAYELWRPCVGRKGQDGVKGDVGDGTEARERVEEGRAEGGEGEGHSVDEEDEPPCSESKDEPEDQYVVVQDNALETRTQATVAPRCTVRCAVKYLRVLDTLDGKDLCGCKAELDVVMSSTASERAGSKTDSTPSLDVLTSPPSFVPGLVLVSVSTNSVFVVRTANYDRTYIPVAITASCTESTSSLNSRSDVPSAEDSAWRPETGHMSRCTTAVVARFVATVFRCRHCRNTVQRPHYPLSTSRPAVATTATADATTIVRPGAMVIPSTSSSQPLSCWPLSLLPLCSALATTTLRNATSPFVTSRFA